VKDSLKEIEKSFEIALSKAATLDILTELRVRFLGKKGSLTQSLHSVGQLPPNERPQMGQQVNVLREKFETLISQKQKELEDKAQAKAIENEKVDIGLPGRKPLLGSFHPLTRVEQKLIQIFRSLGFSIADGPEVETDYYNFEALNFPYDHPARDMQDTFFVERNLLLRTHTSPVQVRVMEVEKPPVSIIVPGRVYRHDSDTTHSPVFHQIEGLCVGENITFAHLKGTLEAFVHMMFGGKTESRFRPSFFPFTEPSAEMDLKGPNGWMEILGCGMVDPNVFEFVGKTWKKRGEANPYETAKVSGFAFGMGVERIAMIHYGISDIRLFYENDLRFLEQFKS